MQDRIIDFIVRNSRAKAEKLKELMTRTDEMTTDIGTVVDGNADESNCPHHIPIEIHYE